MIISCAEAYLRDRVPGSNPSQNQINPFVRKRFWWSILFFLSTNLCHPICKKKKLKSFRDRKIKPRLRSIRCHIPMHIFVKSFSTLQNRDRYYFFFFFCPEMTIQDIVLSFLKPKKNVLQFRLKKLYRYIYIFTL